MLYDEDCMPLCIHSWIDDRSGLSEVKVRSPVFLEITFCKVLQATIAVTGVIARKVFVLSKCTSLASCLNLSLLLHYRSTLLDWL